MVNQEEHFWKGETKEKGELVSERPLLDRPFLKPKCSGRGAQTPRARSAAARVTGCADSWDVQPREFNTKLPPFPCLTFYLFSQFTAIVCTGKPAAPCARCTNLKGLHRFPGARGAAGWTSTNFTGSLLTLCSGEFKVLRCSKTTESLFQIRSFISLSEHGKGT